MRAEGESNTTFYANKNIKIKSVDPTSAAASTPDVGKYCQTTLYVDGGSLGTGANWQWYKSGCGTTAVGSGDAFIINPTSTATYYVRAEGEANTTTCVSTQVTVKAPDFALGPQKPPATISEGGGNYTFNVMPTGCFDWDVEPSTYSWISVEKINNETLNVEISPNNGTTVRTGNYKITGEGITNTYTISQNPGGLDANFSYRTETSIRNKGVVKFTDTSTGTPTSWAWDFNNDGTTDSNLQNPSKGMLEGQHVVKLSISKSGASDTIVKSIRVVIMGNE